MSFAQSSATVMLVCCLPLRSIIRVGNSKGAVLGRGWQPTLLRSPPSSGRDRVSGASSSVAGETRAWKYNCRGYCLWQGAEPKCNREPHPSWLPAVGAGEGTRTPVGALLAAPGCSLAAAALGTRLQPLLMGACVPPKRRNVRWLLHQPWAELGVCGSKGQGCAQLGVEFLPLTACILARLFLPFPCHLFCLSML